MVKVWLLDETIETEDSEDLVREKMESDGYIEGLEYGFVNLEDENE